MHVMLHARWSHWQSSQLHRSIVRTKYTYNPARHRWEPTGMHRTVCSQVLSARWSGCIFLVFWQQSLMFAVIFAWQPLACRAQLLMKSIFSSLAYSLKWKVEQLHLSGQREEKCLGLVNHSETCCHGTSNCTIMPHMPCHCLARKISQHAARMVQRLQALWIYAAWSVNLNNNGHSVHCIVSSIYPSMFGHLGAAWVSKSRHRHVYIALKDNQPRQHLWIYAWMAGKSMPLLNTRS